MSAIEVNAEAIIQTPAAEFIAALLGTYTLQQANTLEWIHSVSIDHGFREYHAFTLEGGCYGDEYQLSFSLYRNKKTNGDKDSYESMVVEFLHNGANVENEQVFLTPWAEVLEQIKADLFNNSFPKVEPINMSHFIDYQVGGKLFVQPLMHGGEGSIETISKIEGDVVHLESSSLLLDKKANRFISGYRQFVYASKDQYDQVTQEHHAYINNIKFMDNVEWRNLTTEQVADLLKIACPDVNMIKPEPFIWHEFLPQQLVQMVYIIESSTCE